MSNVLRIAVAEASITSEKRFFPSTEVTVRTTDVELIPLTANETVPWAGFGWISRAGVPLVLSAVPVQTSKITCLVLVIFCEQGGVGMPIKLRLTDPASLSASVGWYLVEKVWLLSNVPVPELVQLIALTFAAVPLTLMEVTYQHTVVSTPAETIGCGITSTKTVSVRVLVPSLTSTIYWVGTVGATLGYCPVKEKPAGIELQE